MAAVSSIASQPADVGLLFPPMPYRHDPHRPVPQRPRPTARAAANSPRRRTWAKRLPGRVASRGGRPDSPCRLLRVGSGWPSRDAADVAGPPRHPDAQGRDERIRVQRQPDPGGVGGSRPAETLRSDHREGFGPGSYPDLASACIDASRMETSEYRGIDSHLTLAPACRRAWQASTWCCPLTTWPTHRRRS